MSAPNHIAPAKKRPPFRMVSLKPAVVSAIRQAFRYRSLAAWFSLVSGAKGITTVLPIRTSSGEGIARAYERACQKCCELDRVRAVEIRRTQRRGDLLQRTAGRSDADGLSATGGLLTLDNTSHGKLVAQSIEKFSDSAHLHKCAFTQELLPPLQEPLPGWRADAAWHLRPTPR